MRSTEILTGAIVLVGGLALAAFKKASEPAHFKEIAVERINIVEPDGKVRLAISNAALSPPWVFHGKLYPGRPKNAGMIFYNDEGEEDGGIGYNAHHANDKVTAEGGMSFDQYEQDESVTIRYSEENGKRVSGLWVTDRGDMPLTQSFARKDSIRAMPAGRARDSTMRAFIENGGHPLQAGRLFAGREPDGSAVVNLADPHGRARLRMIVDSTGSASIQFLDAQGHVTKSVTP